MAGDRNLVIVAVLFEIRVGLVIEVADEIDMDAFGGKFGVFVFSRFLQLVLSSYVIPHEEDVFEEGLEQTEVTSDEEIDLEEIGEIYKDVDLIQTDNIGEVIEKLSILHCRMWYLEDAISAATTDEEVAELKRKIDICFN